MQDNVQIPPALRSLELPFPPKVYSYLSGLYESQHRGSGLEFSELREYVPGDEVRSIDWRASARGQKTYVKTYVDLRSQDVIFAIDGSSSMVTTRDETSALYNTGALVGLVMRLALSRGDWVGFLTSQNGVVFRSPVMGQRMRARSWYERLYSQISSGQRQVMDWPLFLEQISHNVARRSLIIVISDDFSSDVATQQAFRRLRAMGHRLWCMKISGSTLELSASAAGLRIEDVESGELADWSVLDATLQAEFQAEDLRLQTAAAAGLKAVGVEVGVLASPADTIPTLVRLLTEYKRRHVR